MEVLNDFIVSIKRSFTEIDPNWELYPGLIIGGTHSPHDVEDMLERISHARKTGLPFYGECFGHQLAAIQYARQAGIKDATSEEFGTGSGTSVVKRLPKLNVGMKLVDGRYESFWNNYEVVIPWEKPSNFFTAQFHPSYNSSVDNPHPLILSYLRYAKYFSSLV